MLPLNAAAPSDQTMTLPPSPLPLAEASMLDAASMLTEEAVRIGVASSWAFDSDATAALSVPPPVSPPISTLPPPALPEASMRAPATSIDSPVI